MTHGEINFAIRVTLGIDVVIICVLIAYFYVRNEMLAARAARIGNITYHAGTIFTGIAYGHPDCPPEIAAEYLSLRRKLHIIITIASSPMILYMIFLQKYFR
ncbi:hypothetical protein [Rhizobium mulingense]|uniref:hypothetical protein n=1 Tax=Rhizobium mulingense TaxID=3031128 RepID=UPI002B477B8A|nr:hypothetical protein [Rhizobium sp. MJ21]MEB3044742.1 hypothetical protein [Rhizobium sp. MJ21]